MTRRVGNVLILEAESDRTCELCGKVAECRPYGPGGKDVCFECGMKHRTETEYRFRHRLRGDD